MAFKKKFLYLNDSDRESIEQLCRIIRRSASSRKNLFYIVANFGEFIESSVFEASLSDARRYIDTLRAEVAAGRLQEKYCACIFFELRTFFERALVRGLMDHNPFSGSDNPFSFPDRLNTADLPTLSEVDNLLILCPDGSDILVAVLLALRMGLSVSEIAELKNEQFCLDEKSGRVYLKMWRWDDGEKKELFLTVPGDITKRVMDQVKSTPSDYAFLFRSREKKPYQVRSLQLKLANLQKGKEEPVTFSRLRSLCIYLMLLENIPLKDICRYIGIKGDWLARYDGIPEDMIADASEYVRLKFE